MLTQRRLRRVQACGWLIALFLLLLWLFRGWEPVGGVVEQGRVLVDAATLGPSATSLTSYATAPLPLVPSSVHVSTPPPPQQQPLQQAAAPGPCPSFLPPSSSSSTTTHPSGVGSQGYPPRVWPREAHMYSTDGRAYHRLSMEELWGWSPERATIVSGDSFRDRSPFVCDDDYGVGKPRGCRFTSNQLTNPARVFAKLPHHMPDARSLIAAAGVKHVYVNGGGDTPLTGDEISHLSSNPSLLGFFSINVPRETPHDARIMGIPLGVERTISPRGQFPGMYLQQRTGYNLAAKLCWAPVMAAEVGVSGGRWDGGATSDKPSHNPLLYMNFRTETNEGVRGPAKAHFSGKPWVTDHVNAGDAVDLRLPGGGIKESPLEGYLRGLWAAHANITTAPWFTAVCGATPVIPRGIDPALVPELSLPGYPLFLKAMASVPFVLAPEGNGVSTHRAWEVMYVGTIAVVKEVSPMADGQYRGLPAMMVKEWSEVTPTSLTCYALELFLKAWGVAAGGVGKAGGGGGGGGGGGVPPPHPPTPPLGWMARGGSLSRLQCTHSSPPWTPRGRSPMPALHPLQSTPAYTHSHTLASCHWRLWTMSGGRSSSHGTHKGL